MFRRGIFCLARPPSTPDEPSFGIRTRIPCMRPHSGYCITYISDSRNRFAEIFIQILEAPRVYSLHSVCRRGRGFLVSIRVPSENHRRVIQPSLCLPVPYNLSRNASIYLSCISLVVPLRYTEFEKSIFFSTPDFLSPYRQRNSSFIKIYTPLSSVSKLQAARVCVRRTVNAHLSTPCVAHDSG